MLQDKTDKLFKFITTKNLSLYGILLDENVVGKDTLESEFGISVGDKGEQQLKSKLLDESSDIISKLTDYVYEIRDNSTPLYSGYISFESYTNKFDLHLIGIDGYYLLLSYSSNENYQIEIYDDLEGCLELCPGILSNHLDNFEVEFSNYEENKEYYENSKTNGYEFTLGMEWNFPLPDYLFEKGIISKERLSEIETIKEKIESF